MNLPLPNLSTYLLLTSGQGRKRSRISEYLRLLKASVPCLDCQVNYPYWVMEFDHLGDKKFPIAQFWFHTKDPNEIQRELDKCDIVCSNCHRERTYRRRINN